MRVCFVFAAATLADNSMMSAQCYILQRRPPTPTTTPTTTPTPPPWVVRIPRPRGQERLARSLAKHPWLNASSVSLYRAVAQAPSLTKALQVSQQAFTFTGAPSASAKEDEFSQSWQSHGGEGERGDEGGGERAVVLAMKDASIRQMSRCRDETA